MVFRSPPPQSEFPMTGMAGKRDHQVPDGHRMLDVVGLAARLGVTERFEGTTQDTPERPNSASIGDKHPAQSVGMSR